MKLKELLVCTMMASLGGVAYAAPSSVAIERFKKQPLAFLFKKQCSRRQCLIQHRPISS